MGAQSIYTLCWRAFRSTRKRENKGESSARNGRDVVIPELAKVVMWWAPGRDPGAPGRVVVSSGSWCRELRLVKVVSAESWWGRGKGCKKKNISHIPSPLIFFSFDDASAFAKSKALQSLGCRRRVWKWTWGRVKVKVKKVLLNTENTDTDKRIRVKRLSNLVFFVGFLLKFCCVGNILKRYSFSVS